MKAGATIATDRLVLRAWTRSARDLDAFHRLYSDETVMRFFPYRLTRAEAAERMEDMRRAARENGIGWAAASLKQSGEPVGIVGLSRFNAEMPAWPGVEIGWRLLPEHFGKGLASEAAAALVAHGFRDLALREIVAFAVPANTASLAVMARIGMQPVPELEFDHPRVPATHPHLVRHVTWRIRPGQKPAA